MKYLALAISLAVLAGPCLALDSNGPSSQDQVLLGAPIGTGPGVRGANSPYAPLQERADVLSWSILTGVKTKMVKNRLLPTFSSNVLSLHQTRQRVQGYMMPLEPGQKHKHFLLSSVPLTCSFCVPGGAESLIEVKSKTPIQYVMEAVVVEGVLSVMADDANGMFYRLTEAVPVK